MLVFVPGLMQYLPQPTLAAVVIAASLSLADIPATRRLWRQRQSGVRAVDGGVPGRRAARRAARHRASRSTLSILNVFRQAWGPYRTTLGDVPDVPGYHDIRMYPDAEQLPGLVIYRFDAPLIFANASIVPRRGPAPGPADPPPRWIIVAAEPITDVDTTAADMLEDSTRSSRRGGSASCSPR